VQATLDGKSIVDRMEGRSPTFTLDDLPRL